MNNRDRQGSGNREITRIGLYRCWWLLQKRESFEQLNNQKIDEYEKTNFN